MIPVQATDEENILNVVSIVFNPRAFKSRIRLYKEFVEYMACQNVRLITVEVAYAGRPFEVTEFGNPLHLQLRSNDEMWHKERGINLGIQHLLRISPEAKKVAWIDGDVTFANPNWVEDTLKALDHYDFVQLFSQAINLGPNNEINGGIQGSVFYNFVNKIFDNNKIGTFSEYVANGHPGLAHGATIKALDKVGGLIDFCIHGCYDEETEIYTQRGFIPFCQLTIDDKVLSRSLDEKVEWGDVTKLYAYPYEGEMYKIKSSSLDLLVTPNHNMVYRKISSDNLYFEKVEETTASRRIPKVSDWDMIEPTDFELYGASSIEDFVAFMGIWLAEGWIYLATEPNGSHHYRISIAQKKEDNIPKIKELLDKTFPNISWNTITKYDEVEGFTGSNKELFMYLQQFGKVYDKHIPKTIKELPKRYLKIFMDWFIIGDGNIEKRPDISHTDTVRMYTSSKSLRDDILELAIKTGSWASFRQTLGKLSQPLACGRQIQSSKVYPNYTITLHRSKNFALQTKSISKVPYKGMVYCCETPHHTLLVKRGTKMIWCGNSGDSHMCNALMGDVGSYYQKRKPSKPFMDALYRWQDRSDFHIKKNIGYIPGIVMHHWHGKMHQRQYRERWEIICDHDFDPNVDIYETVNGLYRFTGNKKSFQHDLRTAMINRNEDSIDL